VRQKHQEDLNRVRVDYDQSLAQIKAINQKDKEMLEAMLANGGSDSFIKDYKEYHTDTTVKFRIHLSEANMAIAEREGLDKRFKLCNVININNIVCFDPQGRIKKYESPLKILEEFSKCLRKGKWRKMLFEVIKRAHISHCGVLLLSHHYIIIFIM
jgi:DNA gyrase/topoisomerase IV subunit A